MKGLPTTRRGVLKGIGTAGIVAGGAGAGMISLTGSGAAATVDISATNPGQLSNDRGDLSKVTIDPSFRIEWENMDTAVGKVFCAIEGRTYDDGSVQGEGWTPVFRFFPWLIQDDSINGGPQHADYSKPGTTGYFEITTSLSRALSRSIAQRGGSGVRPLPRPLEVVNESGRPDYEGANWSSYGPSSLENYLEGDSMGTAQQAEDELVDNQGLPLVNNFPGTNAGYYGAVIDTDNFDVPEDGSQDSDDVELRYTFALYTANDNMVGSATLGEGWYEHVRESDVTSGNSVLVMNGEDGYPDVTSQGTRIGTPSAVHYPSLQRMAGSHPAVISTTTDFSVTVENEPADSGATGQTGAGAEGGGQ